MWSDWLVFLILVSVCLPSDALSQHLPSQWGFSYLGLGVSLNGCFLPWTWGISSLPLLLTWDVGYLLMATHHSSAMQPVNPKGNQSWILTEGVMLKLKLQYFGQLMWRIYSLEKTVILGKIEGKRRRGRQRMRWVESITDAMDMNFSKLWETVKDRGAWHAAVHGVTKSWTWLSNWTTRIEILSSLHSHSINPATFSEYTFCPYPESLW